MSQIKLEIIPTIAVNKLIDNLEILYSSFIQSDNIAKIPSVMLWGQPGIGKSQAIKQLASRLEKKLNKEIEIKDVRLLLFNPIDLRGIPTANQDKTLALWLRPQVFDFDPSPNKLNILFLDEISAASPSVQAAAYQIALDKKIGEHQLPNNTIVICAGNRTVDKSVAYKMPKALGNRLLHFEIVSDFESWRRWAIQNDINPLVLGFIKFKPDRLNCFDEKGEEVVFATPRSWEMVSNILNNNNSNLADTFDLIAGIISIPLAMELKSFAKLYQSLPDLDKIFMGLETKVPTATDVLFALVSSMVHYAKKHKDDLYLIENSLLYANKFPPEYMLILVKDYLAFEDNYYAKLLKLAEFKKFIATKGKLLNEIR